MTSSPMASSQRALIFKKDSGKTDDLEFWIGNEKLVKIQNPKQGILPHDMVHFAIETYFPFEGFIQLVFAGHEPGKVMDVLHGFAPKLSLSYSQTSWVTESLVETMQAALWSRVSSFQDFEYAYLKACEARHIPPPPIQESDFQKCFDYIALLSSKWSELKVGETLELAFVPRLQHTENIRPCGVTDGN